MAGFGSIGAIVDRVKSKFSPDTGEGTNYVQSPTRASVVFGRQESALFDGIPYVGFQFFTRINFNGSLVDGFIADYLNQVDRINLNPLVKSINMPSMSIDTDDLNEYNRHRLSQTRINYEPITLTIHDTVDGRAISFWKLYYNYYFQDGLEIFPSTVKSDINPTAFDPEEVSFGYNWLNVENERNLITSIDIFRLGGGNKIEQIRLYNPRISKFTHDEMAYSKNQETIELNFNIEYEYVEYFEPVIHSDDSDVVEFLNLGLYRDIEISTYSPADAVRSAGTPTDEGALASVQSQAGETSFLDTALDLKDRASGLLGDVASVSALSGELNQLQRDVFGKTIVEVPGVDVRQFNTKISSVSRGFEDVSRISSTANGAIGSLGGWIPGSGGEGDG